MAQHIGLRSETTGGEELAQFNNGDSIDLRILELASQQGACLRFIDPYGDTIFNQIQLPILIAELKEISQKSDIQEIKSNIDNVIKFLDQADGVDILVRFIGD